MDNICIIVGAGDFCEREIIKNESDLLVAADGGALTLEKIGQKPDFIVGDFDSLGYIPSDENIVILPKEKDITDTWAAISLGIEKGYKRFRIYGGTGKRESHAFANIQNLIKLTKMGLCGEIVGEREIITTLSNGEIVFDKSFKGYISVFSATESAIVTEKGLKYEIEDESLSCYEPKGVSNEFTGKEAKVRVDEGIVLIIYDKQKD